MIKDSGEKVRAGAHWIPSSFGFLRIKVPIASSHVPMFQIQTSRGLPP